MHTRSNSRKQKLTTLADLLAPVSLSEFLEVFRARKRLHISASDPTRAETLLSWQDIDTLLSGHGLGENVGIWRDSVLVPRQFYTSNGGKRLKVRAFHDLLSQGVSIVVDGVHRSIPQISQLAAAVEREMGIQTQVNAYLSFSKGGAFKPHWDIHDVLAVQVHGRKRWRFWKAVVPHPVEYGRQRADRCECGAGPGDRVGARGRAFHSARRAPRRRCISWVLRAFNHRSAKRDWDRFSRPHPQEGCPGSAVAHEFAAASIGRAFGCARSSA